MIFRHEFVSTLEQSGWVGEDGGKNEKKENGNLGFPVAGLLEELARERLAPP